MKLMFGPVLQTELRVTARRKRYYALRVLMAVALLIALMYQWSSNPYNSNNLTRNDLAQIGQMIFTLSVTILGIAIALLTPALTAGLIAEEKHRKTLHDLLTSQLTSAEIVIDKMLSRLWLMMLMVIVALPVWGIVTLLGGVPPSYYVVAIAIGFAAMFLLASISMLVSVHVKRTRDALIITYILCSLWTFGLLLFELLDNTWIIARLMTIASPVGGISALTGASSLFRKQEPWLVACYVCSIQIFWGMVFLLTAIFRLRSVYANQASSGPVAQSLKGITKKSQTFSRLRRWFRPQCGLDAILWKELHCRQSSKAVRILTVLVFILLMFFFNDPISKVIGETLKEVDIFRLTPTDQSYTHDARDVALAIRVTQSFIYVFIVLSIIARAAASVVGEREGDTWISLAGTPLSAWEILRAKMLGSIHASIGLISLIVIMGLLGVLSGAIYPLSFLVWFCSITLFFLFYSLLGIWVSLRSKSTLRAQTLAIMIFLVIHFTPMLLALFRTQGSREPIWFLLTGTPIILGIALCTYQEFQAFVHDLFSKLPNLDLKSNESQLLIIVLGSCWLHALGVLGMGFLTLRKMAAEIQPMSNPKNQVLSPIPASELMKKQQ